MLTMIPLHPDFGARVEGVDLSAPLSDEVIEKIREAIDVHSLLCFPNQTMSDDVQLSLTRRFGEPEAEHVTLGRTGKAVYFGTVGNVNPDGTKRGNENEQTKYQRGNDLWHSDSSFRRLPSYVSILHAYEAAEEGGATEFVSQRSVYNRLSEAEQQRLDPLLVLHDYVFSRAKTAPVDDNHAASLPPVLHRLVRRNPRTGEKNIYIGSHARSIHDPDGAPWSGPESRALIDGLLEKTTQPEHIYAHFWSPGDTVMWDNRTTLHRGTWYDADRWRRYMRQTRVVGVDSLAEPA